MQPLIKGTLIALKVQPDDNVFAADFKSEACKQLESRFSDLFSIQAPACNHPGFVPVAIRACAVDTRFHKLKSLGPGQPRVVRNWLENELVAFGQCQQSEGTSTPDSNVTGEPRYHEML